MTNKLPEVTRVYQNHHLDSTRWEMLEPRSGDIIVTTAYKAGTTWTQQIINWLMNGHLDPMPNIHETTVWVDARFQGMDKVALEARLAGMADRRSLKSHLPLDGLPYYPEASYIIVGRDPRDVFMSFFNHYSSYTDGAFAALNSEEAVGAPLPRCPDDPVALFRRWISEGWFEWESEGWPMWSNLHHTQTYWEHRHLPNFLFLHYNGMLADLDAAVRRIAAFVRLDVSEAEIRRTVEETTFANVKRKVDAHPEEEDISRFFFEGGMKRFFFKGTNGRWRDVLGAEEIALYEAAKDRVLDPDAARWLEDGGEVT